MGHRQELSIPDQKILTVNHMLEEWNIYGLSLKEELLLQEDFKRLVVCSYMEDVRSLNSL